MELKILNYHEIEDKIFIRVSSFDNKVYNVVQIKEQLAILFEGIRESKCLYYMEEGGSIFFAFQKGKRLLLD